MAIETEAKFAVESHAILQERLGKVGAKLLGRNLETNRIFDLPGGALRGRGRGLRIRTAEDLDTGESVITMTVKGPVSAGPFKSRKEFEVRVSDAETAAKMLECLGFVQILRFQKRRESWQLGECRVELDEPPHIGMFVEIEGPDESAIRKTQKRLSLQHAEHVRESYPRMLAAYCDQHGIADRVIDLPPTSSHPA